MGPPCAAKVPKVTRRRSNHLGASKAWWDIILWSPIVTPMAVRGYNIPRAIKFVVDAKGIAVIASRCTAAMKAIISHRNG